MSCNFHTFGQWFMNCHATNVAGIAVFVPLVIVAIFALYHALGNKHSR